MMGGPDRRAGDASLYDYEARHERCAAWRLALVSAGRSTVNHTASGKGLRGGGGESGRSKRSNAARASGAGGKEAAVTQARGERERGWWGRGNARSQPQGHGGIEGGRDARRKSVSEMERGGVGGVGGGNVFSIALSRPLLALVEAQNFIC